MVVDDWVIMVCCNDVVDVVIVYVRDVGVGIDWVVIIFGWFIFELVCMVDECCLVMRVG